MIAKRKAEQKRKAEEAAAAKEMSQVTESTTTEASEERKSIRQYNADNAFRRRQEEAGRRSV